MELDEGLGDLGYFGADHSRDALAGVYDLVHIEAAPEEMVQPSASYGLRMHLMAPSCFFWKIS